MNNEAALEMLQTLVDINKVSKTVLLHKIVGDPPIKLIFKI